MGESARVAGLVFALGLLGAANRQSQPDLTIPVFPPDNPWNWDITGLTVHSNSDNYIASIGSALPIREDYSFPYSVVPGTQMAVNVTLGAYADESDPGPGAGSPVPNPQNPGFVAHYPFPAGAPIEGGGDAHCLVIDKDNKILFETYQTGGGPPWSATCGAVYDLTSNAVRPDGWTSADAAGLPIFPGLIRYDEAISVAGITHALRVTVNSTQNHHIYPARHDAGSAGGNLPPMGLRLRLKASKDLSSYSGVARKVLDALKKYGIIVADNGTSWYISTTVDSRWNMNAATDLTPIRNMLGSDFEVVNSVDATGAPILPVSGGGTGPPPPPGGGPPPAGGSGGGGGGGCGLLGLEALALWLLRRRHR
jgi:hypothetical protein